MPPAKKKKLPRCVYREGSRACTRAGYGDPPLCRAHELVVEEEEEYEDQDLIDGVLERVDDVIERAAEGIRQFFTTRQVRVPPMPPRAAPPPTNGHRREREPRRQTVVAKPEDPRLVMGFPPDTKLTRDLIKKRQRALAALWHPDAGGSLEAMKRLNTAVDSLLKTLG